MKTLIEAFVETFFTTQSGTAREVYSPQPKRADESPRPVVLRVMDTPQGLVTVTMGGNNQ